MPIQNKKVYVRIAHFILEVTLQVQIYFHSNKVLELHTDVNFKNSQSCPFDTFYFQWDKVSKGGVLVLTSPSLNKKRAADGITIGRDICE